MEKPKLKKLIAREGLIILGIIFTSGIIFFLASLINEENPNKFSLEIEGKKYEFHTSIYSTSDIKGLNGAFKVLFPGVLEAAYPEHSGAKDLLALRRTLRLSDVNHPIDQSERVEAARRELLKRALIKQNSVLPTKMTAEDLGQKVKTAFPEYSHIENVELGRRIAKKYPEYQISDMENTGQATELPRKVRYLDPEYRYDGRTFWAESKSNLFSLAISILILGYPVYLLIRFIIWAVRTLRAV